MSTPSTPVMSEAGFLDRLADPGMRSGEARVRLGDGEVSMSFRRGTHPSVVVGFQGAVDRVKRGLPSFVGFIRDPGVGASQLMISDPCLETSSTLTTSWYLGHAGFELQRQLPLFLERVVLALGATRCVLFGYSAGGFAALYYSWHLPGSVAVALTPQTNLARYYRTRLEAYREACWPGMESVEAALSVVNGDLTALYSKGLSNTLVYLQNSADTFHLREHYAPFLASIGKGVERMITKVDFWGGFGHSSIPSSEWVRWVIASLDAPTTSTRDILSEYYRERTTPSTPGGTSREEDLEIARRLSGAG